MKFFQQILVATASFGLISPIASQASEVINIEGMNDYSRSKKSSSKRFDNNTFVNNPSATLKASLDDLNFQKNNFEAGSFSDTTTMSGNASFQVGAVDDVEGDETQALTSTYSYSLDLNSSFTGDDNLYVGIETGNAGSVKFQTDSSVSGSDTLSVHSIFYQFPIGNFDIAVGPKLDNDDLMPTTISTYSDSFFMGGYSLLDTNYWLYGYTGAGIAVSRIFDNGFNVSGSLIGTVSDSLLTEEGIDVITLSAGYDGDNYGGGLVYVDGDDYCGLINSYISSGCNTLGVSTLEVDVVGIGGYWSPNQGKTTMSATTNIVTPNIKGVDIDSISDFQIGVDHQLGDGVLSASWKALTLYNVQSSTDLNSDTLGSYLEVYYTHPVNDSLDLTYGIAAADPETSSGDSFSLYEYTAIGANATFKF